MKRQLMKMAFLMMLATLALSLNVSAQGFEKHTMRLDFDFMVGDQRLPAGEYTVQPFQNDNQRRFVLVQNKQTGAHALLSALPAIRADKEDAPLTFSKYGEQRYLTRVSLGDFTYVAIKNSTERKLAKQYAALLHNVNESVVARVR